MLSKLFLKLNIHLHLLLTKNTHGRCLRIIFMTAFLPKDKLNVCNGFDIDSTICFEIAS